MTELVFILDRSGSMSGLEADTIGGFNSMIEKQKKEAGEAVVSTVLFANGSGGYKGHCGIYIGGGYFIHAPHTGDVVKISSLSDAYYSRYYAGARRIV